MFTVTAFMMEKNLVVVNGTDSLYIWMIGY